MAHAAMLHDEDPKAKIVKEIGDLSGIEIFQNQVLLAVYQRPEKTKSGLYLAKATLDEDKYQGKVGLVVKKGPKAFVDSGEWVFEHPLDVGDWALYRPQDGWSLEINGVLCRILVDTSVKGVVNSPDQVW